MAIKAIHWQNFLPIAPTDEITFTSSGLHFSRTRLKEGHYAGRIEGGYLVSMVTVGGMLMQQTEHGFDIGQLAKGDIIIAIPSQQVEWQMTGIGEFVSVFLSHRYLERVANSIAMHRPPVIRQMFRHKDQLIGGILSVLQAQIMAKDYRDHPYMEAITRALSVHLLHISAEQNTVRFSGYKRTFSFEQMEKIRSYVIEHLEERISNTNLAQCAHISHFHFYRIFKRTTGITPQQFVRKCRVEHAKLLIEHTALKLAEIAHKTGFADQSHMVRVFRLEFGIAPSRLRIQQDYDRNLPLSLSIA